MIEAVVETAWGPTTFRDTITAGRRLLLRPQRAGRFTRWLPDLGEGTLHIWTNKYRDGIWRTRAQAAQAANKPQSYADAVNNISPETRVC